LVFIQIMRVVVQKILIMRAFRRIGLSSSIVAILLILTSPALQPQQLVVQLPATSTILVAAAASLQPALQEITPLYTTANPNQTVNYNFAASGALQQQIEQGAPVDVFISAADKQMKALQAKGLLGTTPKYLLTNQLVLIVPKQSTIAIADFRQLTQPAVQRIAIGETRTVPAGQYAAETLENLGILTQVKSKFVLGNNVRSVLTAVATGDVDAGIVYRTDAKGSDRIVIAATADEKLHSPIWYPVAVLKSSKSLVGASRYIEFLQSKSARAVFKKYGFGIAKP
jgi:molybdate transport system substrate-binding protein